MNLRVPGPTPLPPTVLAAMNRQMISHRSEDFAHLFAEVREGLAHVFQTQNDVLILVASGTGGMEAAIVNLLSPGDHVLAITIGNFGDRFVSIARAHGAQVTELAFPWGQAAAPEHIAEALDADPKVRAVLITHNETSTGVAQDLSRLSQVVREHRPDALILVDAISSLGALPLSTDEWDIDVVITSSQKALMTPPGLAFVSVSPRAWAAYERAQMPRFYMDLGRLKERADASSSHPFTPAVSLFYALSEALRLIKEEGLDNIFQRHQEIGQFVRSKVKDLGLELFADPRYASNTVTAIVVPEGVNADGVLKRLKDDYGVLLATGPGKVRGKIWRIGHMGYVSRADMEEALVAFEEVLANPPAY